MKPKRNFLLGIFFGILIGWALGFLRMPHVEQSFSFWVGFAACLAFVLSALVLNKLIGNNSVPEAALKKKLKYSLIGIAVVSVLFGSLIFLQNKSFRNQSQKQNKKIEQMSVFIDSLRKSDHAVLVSGILKKADDEAKNNPARKLSDETIAGIITTLNHSLPPYRYWNGDSLSDKALSPGRAQLLLGLKAMKIDSVSFQKIKVSASFAGADLRKADLKNFDLRAADLSNADLQDADFSGADLRATNLNEANLWAANLSSAKMNHANLKRANLSWAQLNGADLTSANFDGADLTNAQLRNINLINATMRWAKAGAAMLNDANLENADLIGTDFTKANMSGARLSGANLGKTNLSEANLQGAQLNKTAVEEKNWLEKLNEWRVIAAKEMQDGYTIENDSTKRYKESKYCLKKN